MAEPYVRQETLEEAYAAMLRRISIDEDIVNWIATALRESHGDQKRFRDESVAKLQQEHTRLQNRLDVMYEDRLDGRIDLSLFERKSGEYRQEQARIQAEINGFGTADGQYMDAGIRLLELTRNMHRLFEKQQAAEKRRLLDFVVSNSVWREGKIVPVWRQPFDMIALANESAQAELGRRTTRKWPKSKLAPRHGFEPRFTAPKAAVLPLDDRGKRADGCSSQCSNLLRFAAPLRVHCPLQALLV